MRRTVIYWKVADKERKEQVKKELGITSVSVNGESEYKGDVERLKPYVEEGLMIIRTKEYEEVRRTKVYQHTIESKPINREKIRRGGGKRKV